MAWEGAKWKMSESLCRSTGMEDILDFIQRDYRTSVIVGRQTFRDGKWCSPVGLRDDEYVQFMRANGNDGIFRYSDIKHCPDENGVVVCEEGAQLRNCVTSRFCTVVIFTPPEGMPELAAEIEEYQRTAVKARTPMVPWQEHFADRLKEFIPDAT